MPKNGEQVMPEIGYLYHYPRTDHPTDIYRLDIHITSEPTNMHFDVQRIRLHVRSRTEEIKQMKVTHPWQHEKDFDVSVGTVIMEDRYGKKAEAFTFGGHLTICNHDKQTICNLVSSAPILEISMSPSRLPSLNMHFVEEVKILLAKIQAKFSDHNEYEQLLITLDPMDLYLACLESLLKKYGQLQSKTDMHDQFLIYLHSQKGRLKAADLIKDRIIPIDKLFVINH